MNLLDATQTAKDWGTTFKEFGLPILRDVGLDYIILIVTLVMVVAFGPLWIVVGLLVWVSAVWRKRRKKKNMALTYQCPECGKLECTERSIEVLE